MASISKDKNGTRRIQFVAPDGKRKAIRLGKTNLRSAEKIKSNVENLLAAAVSGCGWDNPTAQWVAEVPDALADKLAAVGLIRPRKRGRLATFVDSYIASRSDVSPGTKLAFKPARDCLVEFYGADCDLRDVTSGSAEEFRLFLVDKGYAEATISRRIKYAKQLFAAAKRKRMILANPFEDVKAGRQDNKSRFHFVTRADADKVLEACPDNEWRLIFALARYGGLRCPSEHLALTWDDIDWEKNRIRINSPKTGPRTIPLFAELRPFLDEQYHYADPGKHVIRNVRSVKKNLRTRLERIIIRAGLEPWPKLFQNLRSSRETELAEQFPVHVVCDWIGNSIPVAAKHYLQVTDDHFQQAAQNAAQQAAATPGAYPLGALSDDENPEESESLRYFALGKLGPEGFEPPTKGL